MNLPVPSKLLFLGCSIVLLLAGSSCGNDSDTPGVGDVKMDAGSTDALGADGNGTEGGHGTDAAPPSDSGQQKDAGQGDELIGVDGRVLRIRGKGFGSKSHAAPLAVSYMSERAEDDWGVSKKIGGVWGVRGSPQVNQAFLRGDGQAVRSSVVYDPFYPPYDNIKLDHMHPLDKIYISFWMYRDHDTLDMSTGQGNNSKFVRIYEDAQGKSGNLVVTLMCNDQGKESNLSVTGDGLGKHPYRIDYSSPHCQAGKYAGDWFHASSSQCLPEMKKWEHYEIFVDYASSVGGTDTQVILWKDGMTVVRASGMTLDQAGQVNDRRLVRVGQVSGGRTSHYDEYINELYIDDSPAHVFVAERPISGWPDIPEPVHTEVQVIRSWSNDSIEVVFNQGSFHVGDTVYLYVVTSDAQLVDLGRVIIGS